jgi:hypothetical protein
MNASISAEDAFRLTLLLIPEPLAQQVFDLRDRFVQLSTSFHNDWLRRRWLRMEPVFEDIDTIKQLVKQFTDVLSPNVSQLGPPEARRAEMRAALVRRMLAERMRTRRIGNLLVDEVVTEGPSFELEIIPLLRRMHDAAAAVATSRGLGIPPSDSADTAADARRRFPEYDDLIAGLANIFRSYTGEVPAFSDRPAQLDRPRSLGGRFPEFVLAGLPVIGRAFPELGLEIDPEWRRLIEPTPDEVREAYRRVTARTSSKRGQ